VLRKLPLLSVVPSSLLSWTWSLFASATGVTRLVNPIPSPARYVTVTVFLLLLWSAVERIGCCTCNVWLFCSVVCYCLFSGRRVPLTGWLYHNMTRVSEWSLTRNMIFSDPPLLTINSNTHTTCNTCQDNSRVVIAWYSFPCWPLASSLAALTNTIYFHLML